MSKLPERDERGRLKKGSSGNYNGRPESGGVGKPISPLRRNLTKLRRLEDRALEILEISMLTPEEIEQMQTGEYKCNATGKPYSTNKAPTKNQMDSAKFVIKSIESLTKAATSDEIAEMNLRKMVFEDAPIEVEAIEEEEPIPTFSLTLSDSDLEKYEGLLKTYKPEENDIE